MSCAVIKDVIGNYLYFSYGKPASTVITKISLASATIFCVVIARRIGNTPAVNVGSLKGMQYGLFASVPFMIGALDPMKLWKLFLMDTETLLMDTETDRMENGFYASILVAIFGIGIFIGSYYFMPTVCGFGFRSREGRLLFNWAVLAGSGTPLLIGAIVNGCYALANLNID